MLRAWRAAGEHMTDSAGLDVRRSFLAFDGTAADGQPVGPIPVLGLGVEQEGQCAPVDDMAGPGQGKKMFLAGGPLLPTTYPISMVRVGRLGIAAFPSEITKQMGALVMHGVLAKSGGALDRVVIAGLTNAYASYTSTPEEYDGCTYEGSFTLFGRQQGARYRDFAAGLAGALATGGPPPGGASEPPHRGFRTEGPPPAPPPPNPGPPASPPAQPDPRSRRAGFTVKR